MKKVHGVGINDLPDHLTMIEERYVDVSGKTRRRKIWVCPFYRTWSAILRRCYSKAELANNPTYHDKSICDDWIYFSNFKFWMENQDWEDKVLDKDLLIEGNKVYSPETCVFVTQQVNKFVLERTTDRGLPIGASWSEKKNGYVCAIGDGRGEGKTKHLGMFNNPWYAHLAWATEKLKMAKDIAGKLDNKQLADALILRYTRRLEKAVELKGENSGNRSA